MIPKQDLQELFRKELATTLKVMHAYPKDRPEYKPHEKSSDVIKLMSTFVFEMYLNKSFMFGEVLDRNKFKDYKPGGVDQVILDFETEANEVGQKLDAMQEGDLSKAIEFGGTKFTADRFFMMMLCDQIHHRGQLSVYVRLAGGQVPSIYGPSADDPSTNL